RRVRTIVRVVAQGMLTACANIDGTRWHATNRRGAVDGPCVVVALDHSVGRVEEFVARDDWRRGRSVLLNEQALLTAHLEPRWRRGSSQRPSRSREARKRRRGCRPWR